MINFDFNNDCTGCSACADSCSKHCITMDKNKYGFVVPYINVEACNDCKKCEKVCPVLNTKIASSSTPQLYSAYNVDIEERKAGSSGSIMLVLARYILKLDGVNKVFEAPIFKAQMSNAVKTGNALKQYNTKKKHRVTRCFFSA